MLGPRPCYYSSTSCYAKYILVLTILNSSDVCLRMVTYILPWTYPFEALHMMKWYMIGAIWKLIQINLYKEKEKALKPNDRENEDKYQVFFKLSCFFYDILATILAHVSHFAVQKIMRSMKFLMK